MIDPVSDRRPPINPQMALRVAMIGGIALLLFGVIFFRLWYLQVLSGDQYLAQANNNRVRELRVQSPRGEIVDRHGTVLVENRRAIVIDLDPAKLPDSERELAAEWGQQAGRRAARPEGQKGEPVPIPAIPNDELRERFERFAKVLGTSANGIQARVIQQLAQVPYSDVRLKTDVPRTMLTYLTERASNYPGLKVHEVFLRRYPQGELAAQLVGNVGEIQPEQLRKQRYRGLTQGTIIGQDGLEYQYDNYLRGKDGLDRVQVDALGRPTKQLSTTPPKSGRTLQLSLDLELQKTTQKALANVGGGLPGAAVALDPRTGEVLAMASYPSFDPAVFTKPLTQRQYDALVSEDTGAPIFNRAVNGAYPTGSIFKPITAMAGLEAGKITPDQLIDDPGFFKLGPQTFKNAGDAVNGAIALPKALEVSSDVYFYKLGFGLNNLRGQVLQTWAKKFGLGRDTGIDLPTTFKGLIPDRQWRHRLALAEDKCRKKKDIPLSANVFTAAAAGCGISDKRPWSGGDNVQLAVGQGDLQASPLQLAVAYAALENGGKIVKPHLGQEIESSTNNTTIQRIETGGARRNLKLDPTYRDAILAGLKGAANAPAGTSFKVFEDWPKNRFPIFGKTGTAERPPNPDQSWYAAFVPDPVKPIVVVTTVERGGFGADSAAPVARLMLSKWFLGKAGKVVRGDSHTN